jgi:hypothetical protein
MSTLSTRIRDHEYGTFTNTGHSKCTKLAAGKQLCPTHPVNQLEKQSQKQSRDLHFCRTKISFPPHK